MKMPLNWAKEYADFSCTPQEYAQSMTMSGSKVETFFSEADEIKNVVIGKILDIKPHPDSDHLVVCQVEVGQEEPVQIVTGANNLKAGDLVPAALHVSKLPGGKEIRKGKLRGVESFGMLCSLSELGLTEHDFPNAIEDGILVLDEDVKIGTPAEKALGLDDYVFEFEITPNRPDCLSVRGLARETAATFGVPFKDKVPVMPKGEGDINSRLKVSINDALCSRYCGGMVENVRIKPSPRWLRERLRGCGVRPINNIVDITNYVMLEYGQPMHAFDFAYVNGGCINVRRAEKGEKIMTLDGVSRMLSDEMLVIADEKGCVAVAGVMGGEFSGVYNNTNSVVFESACFDGPSVRTTAKKLGMRTESSGRYEKGLNPENCKGALIRALELVVQLDAGDIVNNIVDVYPEPVAERRVKLEADKINALLGTNLTEKEMIDILLPLDFKVENGEVIVPTNRYDVARFCDLAEEVARFVGYNKIEATALSSATCARLTPRQAFDELIIDVMCGFGFYEVETFSFYSKKSFDAVNLPQNHALRKAVVISNPLGEDTSIMRTTALPSVLGVVTQNYNARAPQCAVFEAATEYLAKDDEYQLPTETPKIIAAAYGAQYDYLAIKGVAEGVLAAAGITQFEVVRNSQGTMYHPGRCGDIIVNGEKLATIGEVHPKVLANYGIKQRVVAADINLDVLFECKKGTPLYAPLPKHPAITRDLALVADKNIQSQEIVSTIKKAAGKALESISLFDIYEGDKIDAGKKSLAYNLVLRAADRTLTDEEAEAAVNKILKALNEINITLRQ